MIITFIFGSVFRKTWLKYGLSRGEPYIIGHRVLYYTIKGNFIFKPEW